MIYLHFINRKKQAIIGLNFGMKILNSVSILYVTRENAEQLQN